MAELGTKPRIYYFSKTGFQGERPETSTRKCHTDIDRIGFQPGQYNKGGFSIVDILRMRE
jgi:hypothetical protein